MFYRLHINKKLFQSSPAPRRGRYLPAVFVQATGMVFQSSPAPRRGRYSICTITIEGLTCFNPRPRRGAGATPKLVLGLRLFVVSILARAEARALRGIAISPIVSLRVSILARAEARALPAAFALPDWIDKFQSSPAPRRGRYLVSHNERSPAICFNPRPRRGAGATQAARPTCTVIMGFNPRPRRGAGATARAQRYDFQR